MTDCIIGWTVDENVEGSLNLKPVFCSRYVQLLEAEIDSVKVLSIRESLGLKGRE